MTIILDPGNDANSYSDAASRMWRLTAGLWKGDARDPGNAANSYSDAVARLWRLTAGLWKADAQDLIGTIAGLATPGWVSGQLWHTSANQWQSKDATDLANYNAEVTLYNNEVTAYNNLLNGLNNPDGLTTVAITGTWTQNGTTVTTTLTIPRTGHYMIAIDARLTETQTGFGGAVQVNVSGIMTETYTLQGAGNGNNGTNNLAFGKAAHGDFTAGQTLSISFTGTNSANTGTASGNLYAHFIPNATNHN